MILFVPVKTGSQCLVLRMFRNPLGACTAVAFTSAAALAATLGAEQAWTRLSEPALRELSSQQGVTSLTIDPTFASPAPRPIPAPQGTWDISSLDGSTTSAAVSA